MQIQETERQSKISSLVFIEGKGKLTGKGRQGYQSKTPEANTRNTQGCHAGCRHAWSATNQQRKRGAHRLTYTHTMKSSCTTYCTITKGG